MGHCAKEGLGETGCLGQISGISLQITQVRFSNDLNKDGGDIKSCKSRSSEQYPGAIQGKMGGR